MAALAWVAIADDRDLLRDAAGNPMVFVTLDTSGSMNFTPPCTEIDTCLDIDPYDGHCTTECPLGDELCERICPDYGCIEYDFGGQVPEAYEEIIDVEDGGADIVLEGNWRTSTLFTPFLNENYFHDANTGGGKSVTFHLDVPKTGIYQLYLYYNANEFRATNVPVDVTRKVTDPDTGIETSVVERIYVDQRNTPSGWNYIQTFEFEGGTGNSVKISNEGANFFVVVDGLRLFSVIKPDNATCVKEGYRCMQSLCPEGDCLVPLNADDPRSKFFQARSALHQVLDEAKQVHLGFGTYEQDNVRLAGKHWLYRVRSTVPDSTPDDTSDDVPQDLSWTWTEGVTTHTFPETTTQFPIPGTGHVFGLGAPYDSDGLGDGWNCAHYQTPSNPGTPTEDYPEKYDDDGNFADPDGNAAIVTCFFSEPADMNNSWEMERARRLPKLGIDGNSTTAMWYRDNENANSNNIFKVVYREIDEVQIDGSTGPDGVPDYEYGDLIFGIDVEVFRCTNQDCTGSDSFSIGTRRVYFDLVSDFVGWDDLLGRSAMNGYSYFHLQRTMYTNAPEDCNGLELNDDTLDLDNACVDGAEDDTWWFYNFKQETVEDARGDSLEDDAGNPVSRVDWFDMGDFVPIDWTTTNNEIVRERLAPNTVNPDGLTPDFRTATYWADTYIPGDEFSTPPGGDKFSETNRRLALKDDSEKPLLPIGRTPIAASLNDFHRWYVGNYAPVDLSSVDDSDGLSAAECALLQTDPIDGGWSGVAAERDIDWACRNKYVLFLTDGNENCGGDPCSSAEQLFNASVSTYVIGFGVDDSKSTLGCIAEEGGTGEPLLPRNQAELVETLESILSQIRSESRAFASASIPAIQSTAAEKLYLSSFIPIPGEAFWPGSITAFRKPLPLDEQRRPDTSRVCGPNRQSACYLWDVGEEMLTQAPTLTEVSQGDFRIGDGFDKRRIFYSQENRVGERPTDLVLFRPPYRGPDGSQLDDLEDLAKVLAPDDYLAFVGEDGSGGHQQQVSDYISSTSPTDDELETFVDDNDLITADSLEDSITEVIRNTVKRKSFPSDLAGERNEYILGDIFHANPIIIGSPSDFTYFSNDVCGLLQPNDVPNNCVDGEDRGYRRFSLEHTWRRRMLVTATNDGQLHFFDAGTRRVVNDREVFNDGSGKELFSYIPRLALPALRDQALGDKHIFSLDGAMTVNDVFIDPADSLGSYTEDEREWRTVLIAGMREAGDVYEQADDVPDLFGGYFALDVTQPDTLRQRTSDKSGAQFNDPPQQSLLPVDSNSATGTNSLPSCLDFDYDLTGHQEIAPGSGQYDCKYPFPAELWTFNEILTVTDSDGDDHLYFLDEDLDNIRDLGDTWSRPVVGQIAYCASPGSGQCDPAGDNSEVETMHVAIFGGGMDVPNKLTGDQGGNWLYMVNVETGKTVYKRQLGEGSAPADPAVLDTDNDGIFDRIYIGTTLGELYKVDLTALDSAGDVPSLMNVDVYTKYLPVDASSPLLTSSVIEQRVDDDGAWEPQLLLQTQGGAPIYQPPMSFFIPPLNSYGLAVGTGDREDLWVPTSDEGRFYVIVDAPRRNSANPCLVGADLAFTDSCLEEINWLADPPTVVVDGEEQIDDSLDYILDPDPTKERGWVMQFPAQHRLSAEPFIASGILIFSMFEPVAFIPDSTGGSDPSDPDPSDTVCARTGVTRAFVVNVGNANPLSRLSGVDQGPDPEIDGEIIGGDPDDIDGTDATTAGALKGRDRYHRIAEFTTAPFVDNTSSKNTPSEDDGYTLDDVIDEALADANESLREAVLSLYPRGTRINVAYQASVNLGRNTKGLAVAALVPVAIYPADWQEK